MRNVFQTGSTYPIVEDRSLQPQWRLCVLVLVGAIVVGCKRSPPNVFPSMRTEIDWGDTVFSVAFSPDGKTVASGSGKAVKLWEAQTAKLKRTLTGHAGVVTSVAFSPDGSTVASAGDTVRIWDLQTGALKRTLEGSQVAFSPDGKTVATDGFVTKLTSHGSTHLGVLRLLDAKTGEVNLTLTADGLSAASSFIVFSPNGTTVASGCVREIALWEARTGRLKRLLRGHASNVSSLAFSPDGRRIASGGADGTVLLWDAGTGELKRTLAASKDGVTGDVRSVAFSPDGKTVASASYESIRLWDAGAGELKRTLAKDGEGVCASGGCMVAFSPDGKTLVSGSAQDDTVRLWDVPTGKLKRTLGAH